MKRFLKFTLFAFMIMALVTVGSTDQLLAKAKQKPEKPTQGFEPYPVEAPAPDMVAVLWLDPGEENSGSRILWMRGNPEKDFTRDDAEIIGSRTMNGKAILQMAKSPFPFDGVMSSTESVFSSRTNLPERTCEEGYQEGGLMVTGVSPNGTLHYSCMPRGGARCLYYQHCITG